MNTRPSTQKIDRDILRIYLAGYTPKEIRRQLILVNVMRVYNAIRRGKKQITKYCKKKHLTKINSD